MWLANEKKIKIFRIEQRQIQGGVWECVRHTTFLHGRPCSPQGTRERGSKQLQSNFEETMATELTSPTHSSRYKVKDQYP